MSNLLTAIFVIAVAVGAILLWSGAPQEPEHTSNTPAEPSGTGATTTPTPQQADITGVTIDLSNRGLAEVPPYIFSQTDTEILDLSGNRFSGALQAEIRHMQKLRVLDLSNNNFTGVPAEIGQLTELEVLNLSHNPLTGLPYEIGNLQDLRLLDLRGTDYAKQDLTVIQQNLSPATEVKTDTK